MAYFRGSVALCGLLGNQPWGRIWLRLLDSVRFLANVGLWWPSLSWAGSPKMGAQGRGVTHAAALAARANADETSERSTLSSAIAATVHRLCARPSDWARSRTTCSNMSVGARLGFGVHPVLRRHKFAGGRFVISSRGPCPSKIELFSTRAKEKRPNAALCG